MMESRNILIMILMWRKNELKMFIWILKKILMMKTVVGNSKLIHLLLLENLQIFLSIVLKWMKLHPDWAATSFQISNDEKSETKPEARGRWCVSSAHCGSSPCPWDDGNGPDYTDAGAAKDRDQVDVGAAVDNLGRACRTESRNTSRTISRAISGTTILLIGGGCDSSVEVI